MTTSTWRLPAALVALAAIPSVAGALRLAELLGGAAVLPAQARFVDSPAPVVVHICAAVAYLVLGALQFSATLRRRRLRWHRRSGRILVPLGLLVALSALWMNQFYDHPDGRNELLYVFRLLAGTAMAASIVLGFAAVRRGDISTHRAWMVRAYAIGLGAGTQVFTLGIGQGIFGTTQLTTALCQAAAWAINLSVAERAIRRPARRGRPISTSGPRRQFPESATGLALRTHSEDGDRMSDRTV